MNQNPRIIFAGDRQISVDCLRFLREQGVEPVALLVSDAKRATHASELRELVPYLPSDLVLEGKAFREEPGLATLSELNADYVFGIHFPYIVPPEVLEMPKVGVLNLHPAYLPYNKGWHTPTWALLEGTPYGATLHFMDAGLDTGDIILQREVDASPADTANSIYQKVLALEFEVFKEAWPLLKDCNPPRQQQTEEGTAHSKKDLEASGLQQIDLEAPIAPRELLKRLRAFTTNQTGEAAYFEEGGRRYRVQVRIEEE